MRTRVFQGRLVAIPTGGFSQVQWLDRVSHRPSVVAANSVDRSPQAFPSSTVRQFSLVGGPAVAKKVRVNRKEEPERAFFHIVWLQADSGHRVSSAHPVPSIWRFASRGGGRGGDSQNVPPRIGPLRCRLSGSQRQFGICMLHVAS